MNASEVAWIERSGIQDAGGRDSPDFIRATTLRNAEWGMRNGEFKGLPSSFSAQPSASKLLFVLIALATPGSLTATVHAQTRLLVIDSGNNRVLRYDGTTGAFIDEFIASGSGGLTNPENIQIGPDGHLYVSSQLTGSVK